MGWGGQVGREHLGEGGSAGGGGGQVGREVSYRSVHKYVHSVLHFMYVQYTLYCTVNTT